MKTNRLKETNAKAMMKAEDDIAGFSDETWREMLTARLRPIEPVPTEMTPGGALRKPLKGILFDVYGTLLISGTGDISVSRESVPASKTLRALLDGFGIHTGTEKLLGTFFNEIRDTHQAARQNGTDWPEVRIEGIWSRVLGIGDMSLAKRFAIEFEIIANPVWPMPHIEKLLAACRRAGLAMGIISNAQFYTPLFLRWLLNRELPDLGFEKDLLVYSFEVGCAKPSPRLFDLAAGRLKKRGIAPESVVYVGNDLTKDILPSKRAGFQTALFAGDARSLRIGGGERSRRPAEADLTITDWNQLLPHITDRSER